MDKQTQQTHIALSTVGYTQSVTTNYPHGAFVAVMETSTDGTTRYTEYKGSTYQTGNVGLPDTEQRRYICLPHFKLPFLDKTCRRQRQNLR